ncbi:BLUF domain-containing protein [Hansschlegelia quercus]|uniref:BLUF domain-containing protein n=1 Tax=Hansschlegelia quercus TaxID=2528245 RepID=A0A4Q9GP42_9HYPH|nr:BLUF domain-containing protein [Hansschlegelia quercus]TBN53327.1 BLUF domain-containing protein [Hansschlegelia quercus]
MPLHRIVFYSSNETKLTSSSMRDFVRDVLDNCARLEAISGLTGALLFNERFFLQVMEGDKVAISEQMWKISQDERHSLMVILAAGAIPRRAFLTWTVGYAGRSPELDKLYLSYGPAPKFDPTRMTAASAVDLVQDFIKAEHGQMVKHAEPMALHPD